MSLLGITTSPGRAGAVEAFIHILCWGPPFFLLSSACPPCSWYTGACRLYSSTALGDRCLAGQKEKNTGSWSDPPWIQAAHKCYLFPQHWAHCSPPPYRVAWRAVQQAWQSQKPGQAFSRWRWVLRSLHLQWREWKGFARSRLRP